MDTGVIKTINPATEVVCGEYLLMSQAEVEQVIHDVYDAQQAWEKTSCDTRAQGLRKLADLLLAQKIPLATLITTEMGKPIAQATMEVEKCAKLCEYYAANGEQFLKPDIIQTDFKKSYRAYRPLGIVFGIMPWNYPMWQVMRFAVPNLMVGNAALLKHAPNTMGMALAIEKLMKEAGFPGVFRSLVMDVSLAPFVIHHPKIAGITPTGSVAAGKSVAAEAGAAIKKVVLELGGNDPYVVLEDADLDVATTACIYSRFSNAGQVCIAAKRMIVVDTIRPAFEAMLLEKAKAYVMGDPMDSKTMMGPMARADLRSKLHDQVRRVIKSGATCLLGGDLPTGTGYYYPPTMLTGVTDTSPACQEELFGPVICVIGAKNEQEALSFANDTAYGLTATVFTQDLEKGERIARDYFQAGTCAVNTFVTSDPRLPFGGIKQSGHGRELSLEGMREFVNIKTVIVK